MSTLDPVLIDQVVKQVVAILQGNVAAPQINTTSLPRIAAPTPVLSPKQPAPRVFVTADILQQRVSVSGQGGLIELAPNERLTPSAMDLAEARHIAVRRLPEASVGVVEAQAECRGATPCSGQADPTSSVPAGEPSSLAPQATSSAIGFVVERVVPSVASAIKALGYDGLSMIDYTQTDCWMANLEALSGAVASGQVRAGVALLPFAADAMMLAGKMRSIRPVQGTCIESVSAALRRFDANLLVVEHAVSTFYEIRAMVRLFASQRTDKPTNPSLMATVARLERT
jgi:hypothetical protein